MRSYIRHPSDIPIEFSEDSASYPTQEQLHNVSFGGVSFSSRRQLKSGRIIWLRIAHVHPVFEAPARVSWCKKRDDTYEVGVEFIARQDEFRARMVEQVCYIEHYKREVMQTEGRVLSGEEAAREWIAKYAEQFPEYSEEELEQVTVVGRKKPPR